MSYQSRKAERTTRYHRNRGVKLGACVACNGSGRYDHNGSPPCGACGGTGKVRAETTELPAHSELARQAMDKVKSQ